MAENTYTPSEHDDFCESEQVIPGGWSECSCAYRSARGLVAAHDAALLEQVADEMRAIFNQPSTLGMPSDDWLRARAAEIRKEQDR